MVDFKKVYVSVNWDFLKYLMSRMDFPEQWMGWLSACVFSRHVSLLINGCSTEMVVLQKGLR